MSAAPLLWITFAIVLISRAVQLRIKLASPTARGPEWFLTVPVVEGFYQGPGRGLLRRFKLITSLPFLIEALVWIAAFRTLDSRWIITALLATSVMIIVACKTTHRWAIERAKPYSTLPPEAPLPAMAISLETRKLSDYTHWPFEIMVNFALIGSFAVLVIHAFHGITQGTIVSTLLGWLGVSSAASSPNVAEILRPLWGPVLALYVAAGCVLLKYCWLSRNPLVPAYAAEEYRAYREKIRRYQMFVMDFFRLECALILVLMAAQETWPAAFHTSAMRWLMSIFVLACITALFIYVHTQQRRNTEMGRKLKPMTPFAAKPPIPRVGFHLGGWAYYNEDSPALVLRGPRGLALNFANWQAYLWLGYLALLAFLILRSI